MSQKSSTSPHIDRSNIDGNDSPISNAAKKRPNSSKIDYDSLYNDYVKGWRMQHDPNETRPMRKMEYVWWGINQKLQENPVQTIVIREKLEFLRRKMQMQQQLLGNLLQLSIIIPPLS